MDSSVPGQADLQAGSRPVSANDPVQCRRIVGDGHRGPEQSLDRTLGGDRGHVRQHRVQSGRVDVVVLSGRDRQVPAVDDYFGQRDDPPDLAGEVDAAGTRHAVPRRRLSPCSRQFRQPPWVCGAPVLVQRCSLDRRGVRELTELLLGGRGECQRQATHMPDKVSQAQLLARRTAVELRVGHIHQHFGGALACRRQIDHVRTDLAGDRN